MKKLKAALGCKTGQRYKFQATPCTSSTNERAEIMRYFCKDLWTEFSQHRSSPGFATEEELKQWQTCGITWRLQRAALLAAHTPTPAPAVGVTAPYA